MVDTPNDALQSHKVLGQNSPRGRVSGQKSLKNSEILEKLSPGEGGGYWGGRPLGDMSTYLRQHRRDIAQTFMVDSPSESLQTHKVSGQNSPRGRVSEQQAAARPMSVKATRCASLSAPCRLRARKAFFQWSHQSRPSLGVGGGLATSCSCKLQQASKQQNLQKLGPGERES